jgi:methylated-DNA-protein-cysteine methyltransferase-like protein
MKSVNLWLECIWYNYCMANTFELIYDVVKQIPKGKVATYGQIAMLVGNDRLSRVVGYALHVNPDPTNIPCHRVVNRFGGLSPAFAFGGVNMQAQLLEAEGVEVINGRVDLSKYQALDFYMKE